LLVLSFRGLDRFCPGNGKPRAIDLHDFSLIIDRRYQAIAEDLATLAADRLFEDSSVLSRLSKASVGIILLYNPDEGLVRPLYQDRLQIQLVLEQMQEQKEISRLKNFYHRELKKLKNYTYHTEDYQKVLSDSFHERLQKLIEQALKDLQKKMRRQRSFTGIERVSAELMALAEENAFSEEQIQLATDMQAFNRDRLRSRRLEAISRDIDDCSTTAELLELWQKIRVELVNNQSHLGKEFEDLVTSRFDQQLEQLESA
jgi:hypothetical protein